MNQYPRARLEAEPVYLSYRFSIPLPSGVGDKIRHHVLCAACSWVVENVGPFDPDVWIVKGYSWAVDVHFRDSDAAMKFKLAWC